jgi:hypothetical protein
MQTSCHFVPPGAKPFATDRFWVILHLDLSTHSIAGTKHRESPALLIYAHSGRRNSHLGTTGAASYWRERNETPFSETESTTKHNCCAAWSDHEPATLQVILSRIPEKNSTFLEIADLIGSSYEWIRVRLIKNPERLYRLAPAIGYRRA